MNINYFGEIAEITSKTSEAVVLKNASMAELLNHLESTYKLNLNDIHIAINHNIVSITDNITLKDTDEIAILSPFAGG